MFCCDVFPYNKLGNSYLFSVSRCFRNIFSSFLHDKQIGWWGPFKDFCKLGKYSRTWYKVLQISRKKPPSLFLNKRLFQFPSPLGKMLSFPWGNFGTFWLFLMLAFSAFSQGTLHNSLTCLMSFRALNVSWCYSTFTFAFRIVLKRKRSCFGGKWKPHCNSKNSQKFLCCNLLIFSAKFK